MDAFLNKRSGVYYKNTYLLYSAPEICGIWGVVDRGCIETYELVVALT
jgi:hypothetical protein